MKLITFLILISMNAYSAIDNYTLQGKGMYEWMWLDVYEASLYRVNNSKKLEANNLYQHDFILELNYAMNLSGSDVAKQSVKEMEKQETLSESEKKTLYETFEKIFPDVKEGDRIRADYKKEEGIKFYLNEDKLLGEIKSFETSHAFLNIWLGEKTSDPALRKKLLGMEE